MKYVLVILAILGVGFGMCYIYVNSNPAECHDCKNNCKLECKCESCPCPEEKCKTGECSNECMGCKLKNCPEEKCNENKALNKCNCCED